MQGFKPKSHFMKKVVLGVAAAQLGSCASHKMVDVPPPPEAALAQQQVLRDVLPQEDPAAALLAHDGWVSMWRFELIQDGVAYQYLQLVNLDTHAVFGLVQKDATLVSLLSREHAEQLRDCLTPFNLDHAHWSDVSFEAIAAWAMAQSIANQQDAFAAAGTFRRHADVSRSAELRRRIDTGMAFTLNAVVYAPFLLVGVPLYYLSGDAEEDENRKEHLERERSLLDGLVLGQRAPLADGLPSTSEFPLGDMTVLQYDRAGFAYGTRDGRVVMIEAPLVWELYERQLAYGRAWYERDDCRELLPEADLKQHAHGNPGASE